MSETLAIMSDGSHLHPFQEDGMWGYIDNRGNVAISPKFLDAEDFSEGLARVLVDDYRRWYGFIDIEGNITVRPDASDKYTFGPFRHGRSAFRPSAFGGLCGFVDASGSAVIPGIYISANDFHEGVACISQSASRDTFFGKKLAGVIDIDGAVVIPVSLPYTATRFCNGLCCVISTASTQWRCGYIDIHGAVRIPLSFDMAFDFSEGVACVRTGRGNSSRFGYIDADGNVRIPLNYDRASTSFQDGRAFVAERSRVRLIDTAGAAIADLPIATCDHYLDTFSEGLARFLIDKKDDEHNFGYELNLRGQDS